MHEVVNLDDVCEWAASEENVWEFLENVKWNILVNNPNEFVTIKEIAKALNWQFGGHATVLHFLCRSLGLSPDMEIEERKDEKHSLVAYKYKPDTQGDRWTGLSRQESYQSFITNVIKQAVQYEKERTPLFIWYEIYCGKLYHSCITKIVKFFKDVKREKEDERRYKLLDEFEEKEKQLRKSRMEEMRARIEL